MTEENKKITVKFTVDDNSAEKVRKVIKQIHDEYKKLSDQAKEANTVISQLARGPTTGGAIAASKGQGGQPLGTLTIPEAPPKAGMGSGMPVLQTGPQFSSLGGGPATAAIWARPPIQGLPPSATAATAAAGQTLFARPSILTATLPPASMTPGTATFWGRPSLATRGPWDASRLSSFSVGQGLTAIDPSETPTMLMGPPKWQQRLRSVGLMAAYAGSVIEPLEYQRRFDVMSSKASRAGLESRALSRGLEGNFLDEMLLSDPRNLEQLQSLPGQTWEARGMVSPILGGVETAALGIMGGRMMGQFLGTHFLNSLGNSATSIKYGGRAALMRAAGHSVARSFMGQGALRMIGGPVGAVALAAGVGQAAKGVYDELGDKRRARAEENLVTGLSVTEDQNPLAKMVQQNLLATSRLRMDAERSWGSEDMVLRASTLGAHSGFDLSESLQMANIVRPYMGRKAALGTTRLGEGPGQAGPGIDSLLGSLLDYTKRGFDAAPTGHFLGMSAAAARSQFLGRAGPLPVGATDLWAERSALAQSRDNMKALAYAAGVNSPGFDPSLLSPVMEHMAGAMVGGTGNVGDVGVLPSMLLGGRSPNAPLSNLDVQAGIGGMNAYNQTMQGNAFFNMQKFAMARDVLGPKASLLAVQTLAGMSQEELALGATGKGAAAVGIDDEHREKMRNRAPVLLLRQGARLAGLADKIPEGGVSVDQALSGLTDKEKSAIYMGVSQGYSTGNFAQTEAFFEGVGKSSFAPDLTKVFDQSLMPEAPPSVPSSQRTMAAENANDLMKEEIRTRQLMLDSIGAARDNFGTLIESLQKVGIAFEDVRATVEDLAKLKPPSSASKRVTEAIEGSRNLMPMEVDRK